MNWNLSPAARRVVVGVMACMAMLTVRAAQASADPSGLQAVRTNCSGCHREIRPGHFQRISEERKTPEGWAMTVFRMRHVHGVNLTPQAQAAIIRYLSDVQGLAPSETRPARYALERAPNVPDMKLPGDLGVMCGRCHSLARVALQRRDAKEWLRLINFHVGQYPSLEYQEGSRDIHWWQIASTKLPGQLARLFPLHSAAWHAWKDAPHASLAGQWVVYGNAPGRGEYFGTARILPAGLGDYRARYTLRYAQGAALGGESTAFVYTGYQWRGSASLGGRLVREVYFASPRGNRITGRWFEDAHAEIGGTWTAVRAQGGARLLAVVPAALRAGSSAEVALIGRSLSGPVRFGPGVTVQSATAQPYGLLVTVRVAPNARTGYRTVTVGHAVALAQKFAVYRRIEAVSVEPAYAIARLGGGTLAPVAAQFAAVGYTYASGPHGERQRVRLGDVPVTWQVVPFDAVAKQHDDVRFAGHMGQNGRFMPALAGPDPARQFSADNTGNLFVVATLAGAKVPVSGRAHLIVTVQRWINPPIY